MWPDTARNSLTIKDLCGHDTELAGAHNAHNHPSGVAEPSRSDEALTQALKQALALVDVKTLDHFVVGSGAAMSFAERGLL
jgi:DNA repair protein RadC